MVSIVVPKEEDSYIQKYALDRIEEEVCKKMPAIIRYADWKKVIPACIMIEQEPLGIYGYLNDTIKDATKNVSSGTSIQYIRAAIKFRIYMLLYYRHCDNELYRVAVFPNLIEKMKEEKFDYDIEWINKSIDKIIDLEREVRELREKNSHTDNGSTVEDRKKIVLTNQSEMARVVKAMYMAGYFKNSDGSNVSEAEVGRKLCADFGLKSTWDSMVQAAYKKESIAETFDTLKDKAVEHYKKVNKIQESNAQNTIR